MPYKVFLHPSAARQRDKLPGDVRLRIDVALHELAGTPRPEGCRRLTGTQSWRVRVGDYRIVYEILDGADQVVLVGWIGLRRDAFRGS
jgi:mRNA interferase RelE/StbE